MLTEWGLRTTALKKASPIQVSLRRQLPSPQPTPAPPQPRPGTRCLSRVGMGDMNSVSVLPLISSPRRPPLGKPSGEQPALESELVTLGNSHQPTPPPFLPFFMLLPRIMWRWTHSRWSVWRTGRGVARFPPVKVRTHCWLVIRVMSPQHWGDVSRAHTGWGEPSKCTLRGMGQEFYRHSRLDEKLSNVPFSSKVLGFQKTLLVSPSLLSKY